MGFVKTTEENKATWAARLWIANTETMYFKAHDIARANPGYYAEDLLERMLGDFCKVDEACRGDFFGYGFYNVDWTAVLAGVRTEVAEMDRR